MKCQAPFKYGFSRTILCNAVIISFTLETTTFPMSLDNVLVTVLFLNPTSNPMVPCRYWAGNKCMYSDQDCEFSHGTQIPLTKFVDYNNMGKIFGRKETKLGSEESLGDWEKYTKGIGSKIMAKMGYIKGTGLGKNNEGRVKPVVATVLPKRQSLV
ncbi:zinc finger CCCH-type with G patch domain-containing protein-like [Adelges cooleyi]|uniref:zinc finger CCCH-type with G patch domain-containing protein-like n=1 Tax=Adelges cooleyi TaxID=133065 RepID=UPI00217F5120|nr:zinc finger CCCH-type with G patch domain-containing protein-like [Adelges cooleyi]